MKDELHEMLKELFGVMDDDDVIVNGKVIKFSDLKKMKNNS